jgi:hypothetical protein
MDPNGMPCSYGDLTSCNQMSQAAYRYTAAAATMARSYNPVTVGPTNPLHHSSVAGTQCSVMGSRQDVHRSGMFPSSMNLNCKCAVGWKYLVRFCYWNAIVFAAIPGINAGAAVVVVVWEIYGYEIFGVFVLHVNLRLKVWVWCVWSWKVIK